MGLRDWWRATNAADDVTDELIAQGGTDIGEGALRNKRRRKEEQMKEVRKHVIIAARFTLLVVGPASLIAGIVLLVSNNDAISSIIFFSVLAVDLLAVAHWSRRHTARQKQQKAISLIPEAQMTVHEFIAHVKMHPELLPAGMTEFDLERFRKLFSGTSQAGIDHWVEQCSRRTHEQHS